MAKRKRVNPVHGESLAPARALLSGSSILILSGFLVGLGFSHGLSAQEQWHVFMAAGCGLLSFFVLDGLSRRRAIQAIERQARRATRRLEHRIGRHIGDASARDEQTLESEHRGRDLMLHAVMHGRG